MIGYVLSVEAYDLKCLQAGLEFQLLCLSDFYTDLFFHPRFVGCLCDNYNLYLLS